jgi:sulfur carrier protein ThiS adenylyltransferase
MNILNEVLKSIYYSNRQLQAIQNTKIGIGGCGGLGSNIAWCLVRSGFCRLELIDDDRVEASNLNRQTFFPKDVGHPKVEVLAAALRQLNPDLHLKTDQKRITAENIKNTFIDCDIVIEAFDRAADKALFYGHFSRGPKLTILGNGVAGTNHLTDIDIIQPKKNVYIVGDGHSDVDSGLRPFAPKVTACAALMAGIALQEVLKK